MPEMTCDCKPFGLNAKNWFAMLIMGLFMTTVDFGLIAIAALLQPLINTTHWSMLEMSALCGAPYVISIFAQPFLGTIANKKSKVTLYAGVLLCLFSLPLSWAGFEYKLYWLAYIGQALYGFGFQTVLTIQ
jgi:MFS family permease